MKYLILLFFPFFQLWALTPIESLILGDFSDDYMEKKNDPLNYLFSSETAVESSTDNQARKLIYYRGQIEEGRRLGQYCKKNPQILYSALWKRTQAARSVIATLQYIGLDIVTRALPQYAKHFEFDRQEYQNLVTNMVGNYCSKNMSIISLKQLRKVMMVKFDKDSNFKLPSIDNSPYFSDVLKSINVKDEALKYEMFYTMNIFKMLCSWGNEVENVRLLVPILRNPQIMAFIIRQMSGKKLEVVDEKVIQENSEDTIKVVCDNLICRKSSSRDFFQKIPRAIGSTDLQKDLETLYCQSFRDIDYQYSDQVPRIKKMINEMSFETENFSVAQLFSLMTGVPDFFLRSQEYSDWKKILRSSVDDAFDKWAKRRSEEFSTEVFFEESLTVEKVSRKLFFNKYSSDFKVFFDVNLGEFDRGTQVAGKVSVSFDLKLPQTYLAWIRDRWIHWDPRNPEEREVLQENFKKYITDEVQKARLKFKIPVWRGDLERLIVREVLEQLNEYKGNAFDQIDKRVFKIPVVLNFSPFALKYIRYKYKVKGNEQSAVVNYR